MNIILKINEIIKELGLDENPPSFAEVQLINIMPALLNKGFLHVNTF